MADTGPQEEAVEDTATDTPMGTIATADVATVREITIPMGKPKGVAAQAAKRQVQRTSSSTLLISFDMFVR